MIRVISDSYTLYQPLIHEIFNSDVPEEVKYKYALLDVFGDDCFPIFINILQVGKT
jgi:hypothetical protein